MISSASYERRAYVVPASQLKVDFLVAHATKLLIEGTANRWVVHHFSDDKTEVLAYLTKGIVDGSYENTRYRMLHLLSLGAPLVHEPFGEVSIVNGAAGGPVPKSWQGDPTGDRARELSRRSPDLAPPGVRDSRVLLPTGRIWRERSMLKVAHRCGTPSACRTSGADIAARKQTRPYSTFAATTFLWTWGHFRFGMPLGAIGVRSVAAGGTRSGCGYCRRVTTDVGLRSVVLWGVESHIGASMPSTPKRTFSA